MYPSFTELPPEILHTEVLTHWSDRELWALARTSRAMLALAYRVLLGRDWDVQRAVLNSLGNHMPLLSGVQANTIAELSNGLRSFINSDTEGELELNAPRRLLALFALWQITPRNEEKVVIEALISDMLVVVGISNPLLAISVLGRLALIQKNDGLYDDCCAWHQYLLPIESSATFVDHLFAVHAFPDVYEAYFSEALQQPQSISTMGIDKRAKFNSKLEAAIQSGLLAAENTAEIRSLFCRWLAETSDVKFIPIIAATLSQLTLEDRKAFVRNIFLLIEQIKGSILDSFWTCNRLQQLILSALKGMTESEVVSWLADEIYPLAISCKLEAQKLLPRIVPELSKCGLVLYLDKTNNTLSQIPKALVAELDVRLKDKFGRALPVSGDKRLILLRTLLRLWPQASGFASVVKSAITEVAAMPEADLLPILSDTIFPLLGGEFVVAGLAVVFIKEALPTLSAQSALLCLNELLPIVDKLENYYAPRHLSVYEALFKGIAMALLKLPPEEILVRLREQIFPLLADKPVDVQWRVIQAMQVVDDILPRLSEKQAVDVLDEQVFPRFVAFPPPVACVLLQKALPRFSETTITRLLAHQIYPLLEVAVSNGNENRVEAMAKIIIAAVHGLPPEQATAVLRQKVYPLCESYSMFTRHNIIYRLRDLAKQRPEVIGTDFQKKLVQSLCTGQPVVTDNPDICAMVIEILTATAISLTPEDSELLLSTQMQLLTNDRSAICFRASDLFIKLYRPLFTANSDLRPNLLIPANAYKRAIVHFIDRLLMTPHLTQGARASIINQVRHRGSTLLPIAIRLLDRGNSTALKTLLDLQIELGTHAGKRDTLLHSVCARCDEEHLAILEHLLETYPDLDVNARNADGETPVHYAAAAGNTRAIARLVARGGGLAAITTNGFGAYRLAWEAGHIETACYILDLMAPRQSSFSNGFLSFRKRTHSASVSPDEADGSDEDSFSARDSFAPNKSARH